MKHIGIVKQDDCTGCLACLNACPSKAITIQKGFGDTEYPLVNEMKCTSCGLCQKVCSAVHNGIFREPLSCYAAYHICVTDKKEIWRFLEMMGLEDRALLGDTDMLENTIVRPVHWGDVKSRINNYVEDGLKNLREAGNK